MRWWWAIFVGAGLAAAQQDSEESKTRRPVEPKSSDFRVERSAVPGGAELLTVFGHAAGSTDDNTEGAGIPLVSVLRDTLGDSNPENDRLRYVWVLTAARPTWLQRVAAATPFYYWRASLFKNADRVPSPVLDLSSARRPVWSALAGSVTQLIAFDPHGALLRSSTRSYRNNTRDHRQLHLLEGLAILSQLENAPETDSHLTQSDLLAIQARLSLASQTLGGLVSESHLPDAYMKQRTRSMEDRGHNWELLRQRAEANGLFFEPFGLGGSPTQALVWVAREDAGSARNFDGNLLSMANPFGDSRIKNWTGYSEMRCLETENRCVELIPLALYSLDHPKVPLLLVDFRDTRAPKRREMIRHATVDVLSGIIGYSRWGNWPYFAGTWTWSFVRSRHGVANSRAARIRAYSQVRQWLAFDPMLDPELRADLRRRLETLGVNPLEDSAANEARFAKRQFAALDRYAQDPRGLVQRLERDRKAEGFAYDHGLAARVGLNAAYYATLGLYQHREDNAVALKIRIDGARRASRSVNAVSTDATP